MKVLIADDHRIMREGLRQILEAQPDITVVGEAGNGYEAIAQAARTSPDVVLMDILMPELNGIDATQQILSTLRTRVVILSMHSSAEYVLRAFQAGASGYVVKTSAGADVVSALRTVYAGGRYTSPEIVDILIDNYIAPGGGRQPPSPVERLTVRERQVLQLIVEGKSRAEIARKLALSPKSIATYRSRIMTKLSVRDLPGLIKFALQHGITPPE